MSSVEATIYRALLRAAKTYDKAPILRALLAYEPFQDLPKQERDTFATFLGEKHSFYLPLSEERSVVDAVRREFRSGHGSLDRALVALNTLNRRRSSALKRGLSVDSEPNPVSPDERLTILNKPVRGSVLLSHPMLGGEFDRKAILVLGYHPTKGAYGVALNSPKPAGWYYIFNKPRRNRSNFKEDPVEQPGAGSSAAPQKGESAGEEVGEEHAEHKDASHANTQGDVVPSTEERATLDDFEDFAFDLLSASVDVVERLAEQEGEAGVRALASALGMKKYVAPGQKTNEQMQLKLQQMLLEEMPRTPSVLPPGGEAQDANEFAMAMIKAVCQVVFSLDDDDDGHDEAALAELPTVLTVLSAAPSDMSDSEEGESSDDEEFDDSDAEALLQSVNHAWADAMRLALRHMAIDLRSLLCDAVERHYRGVPQPGRNPIGRQRRSNGKPRNGRPGFTNDGLHEEGHQHEGPEEEEEERPRLVMYGGPIPGEFTFHTVADVRGPKVSVPFLKPYYLYNDCCADGCLDSRYTAGDGS